MTKEPIVELNDRGGRETKEAIAELKGRGGGETKEPIAELNDKGGETNEPTAKLNGEGGDDVPILREEGSEVDAKPHQSEKKKPN